jgi:hypothetical protein
METWDGVDFAAFERHRVWCRPDLRSVLIHVGPLLGLGVVLCEIGWTAECGALGMTSLIAQRTGETAARVVGDCPTAPQLRVTITLEPTCNADPGPRRYRATNLTVDSV